MIQALPDIGDFDDMAVIELLVKVGDTDKASMEIPSSHAGE